MGVFLLRSYCEQKELYKNIQVPPNNAAKNRVIVFDAPGALKTFLRPMRRGLLYDFHQQQTRVRNMVRAFKQQGYELVVFLDCAIPDDKLTTWYRRRAVEAATLKKLNSHLSAEAAKDKSIPDGLWLPPNTALQLLGDTFVEQNCKVFFSFDDSDREAAYWAKENGAYAIITDDTDFLCYEGVDRIWAANIKLPGGRAAHTQHIRVNELKRQKLLDALGLNQTQLQQLAGLLGNDHIKHISKEKIAQLKEAHPNEHVVALLAKQVLELQPSLASISPAAAAAAAATAEKVAAAKAAAAERAAIDPAVRSTVAAAVANVVAAAEPINAKGSAAKAGAAADNIDPAVRQLVAAAVRSAVAAVAEAGSVDDEEEEEEQHDESHLEEEEHHSDAHEDESAATASSGTTTANSTDMLLDRCKRSMLQYGPADVKPPVQVGNGDHWLLKHKGILMRGIGLEDMSKTPCHLLLQPLRLSVYSSMGLSSVTEYMCFPDEKWKEWAAGRVVTVPSQAAAGKKGKQRRTKGAAFEVHPAVKKLVAAAIANVLEAAGEKPTAAQSKPAANGDAGDIHPAVKKLVAAAIANVIARAARQSKQPFDPLPKNLPQKPQELAAFIIRRLRALDPSAEQFSRKHEQLLLLQLTHRQGTLAHLRAQRRPLSVQLADLHAANLFLQAYTTLQIAADGKLPRITALLNVEVFHSLCQNQDLASKLRSGPSDAETGRQAGNAAGPGAHRQAGMLAGPGRGMVKPVRGALVGMGPGRGMPTQPGVQPQRGGFRGGPGAFRGGHGQQQPLHGYDNRGAPGRRDGQQQPGYPVAAGYNAGGTGSVGPNRGRGQQQHREGYQPYQAGGAAAGSSGGRDQQQQQQQREPLTWQQRQHRQQAGGQAVGYGTGYQQPGYQQGGYPQYQQGGYQHYDQSGYYQQYGQGYSNSQAYGSGYGQSYNNSQGYGDGSSSQGHGNQQGFAHGYGAHGGSGGAASGGYLASERSSGYGASAYAQQGGYDGGSGGYSGGSGGYGGGIAYGNQQYSQTQYPQHGGRGGQRQQLQQGAASNGGELTWQQQQMVGSGRGRQPRGSQGRTQ